MINLTTALALVRGTMSETSQTFQPKNWQSIDVSKMPGSRMQECLNVNIKAHLDGCTDLDRYKEILKPNLPWADEHFEQERISGKPWNPGTTWKTWPWGNSADKFRNEDGQFSHSYAERFWPRYAGQGTDADWATVADVHDNFGIRYRYGDLDDLINHLLRDPESRQAYLPIWFPEDTGVVHKERVPCTLGYWFVVRNGQMHMHYSIRSCDYYRHFHDDVYLAIRLMLFILTSLQIMDAPRWRDIRPGDFSMWIGSLHLFINDYNKLFKKGPT